MRSNLFRSIGWVVLLFGIGLITGIQAGWTAEQNKKETKKKKEKDGELNPVGKNKEIKAGEKQALLIWREKDKDSWHLWFTSPKGDSAQFTGSIKTEQGQLKPTGGQGEKTKRPKGDQATWRTNRHIQFQFTTKGGADQLDFDIDENVKELDFDIQIDGKDRPKMIRIGKDGQSPPSGKFTLPTRP